MFEEQGGFDDVFFASHEDVDLSYRARLRGSAAAWVANAVVLFENRPTSYSPENSG